MADFSFAVAGNNAVFAYQGSSGRFYTASIRVSKFNYDFGVTSTESHARDQRAFYPHRRVHGMYNVTVDCIHYREYKQLMNWLQSYRQRLLDTSAGIIATPMHFKMPSRNINRLGILCTGIDDHDNTGSMVFEAQLQFATVSVPGDNAIPMLYPQQTSEFQSPKVDPSISREFYPVTGNTIVDSHIYDNLNKIDPTQIQGATLPPADYSHHGDSADNATNAAVNAAISQGQAALAAQQAANQAAVQGDVGHAGD